MRTNDLVSLYVSFVETNGGKSRPVLIRRVSEQTVEAFKITSQYEKKSAYIKQQYYPIQDWQSAGLKKPSWVDLGNIYCFPKAGLNFKEIGHLSKLDQNKSSAFTAIVNSLVKNLINPLIGLFIGKIDLSNLKLTIGEATFRYGSFLNAVINFLIIALVVFILMKLVNKFTIKKEAEKETPAPSNEEIYLRQIRDALQEKKILR